MNIRVLLVSGSVLASSGSVVAQEAAKPVPLPQVTVEAQKKKAAKPAAKKSAAPTQVAKKASPQPSPVVPAANDAPVGTTNETATGPVDGYVATRSAIGTKTDTPLIETPRTVNVVTRDQIDAQKPQSVKEALGYTPAVQNQTSASSIFDNIAVRGFTAPIFLDGLRLPSDFSLGFARIRLEPYTLERLEVLKGPASGLFGSSPPGGLINAVSKRPQQTPHNETFVQYGTDNLKAVGFDSTGPIDRSGVLSYRVSGLARDTDLDFDFADRQRYAIAPSLTIRPSADTSLTLLGSAQKDGGFGPHQFVPLELTKSSAPLGRISRSSYYGEPGFDDYSEEQWQIGYAFEHRFNSIFQIRQNVRYSETEQDIAAIRANSPLGLIGPRTIRRNAATVDADAQAFQADTQLQSNFTTGPFKHVLLTGVDYLNGSGSSLFKLGAATPIDAYNPVHTGSVATPGIIGVFTDGNIEQTGVYVQDQIKLGQWIATLGLRHDWARSDLDDLAPGADPASISIDDEAWTGSAGLSYIFANGLAPYVSYSTSFLPVSGQQLLDDDGNPFKPTTGEGYEAGVKYQPPGTRTLLSAAVFQNTQQNVVVASPVDPNLVVQTGEVRMRGFEVDGKASLSDNFDVIAGYGYVEPIITKGNPPDGGDPGTTGNDFSNVARHTASLWGMYTWRHGMLAGFGLGAGIRYVGTQFAEDTNDNKVPAYTLVDAAISYELGRAMPNLEGAKLQLNAYNLFDEYYVAACTGSANFCGFGADRSFVATLKYEW